MERNFSRAIEGADNDKVFGSEFKDNIKYIRWTRSNKSLPREIDSCVYSFVFFLITYLFISTLGNIPILMWTRLRRREDDRYINQ